MSQFSESDSPSTHRNGTISSVLVYMTRW